MPINTEAKNGQNPSDNHPPNQGGTTQITSLMKSNVTNPLKKAANHPANHPLTIGVTTKGNAKKPINTETMNGQNHSDSHPPNQGDTTQITSKYCCYCDE